MSVHVVDPAAAWAASGAMALTGRPDGPPLLAPDAVTLGLTAVADEIAELTARLGRPVALDPLALLGERAALVGYTRRGMVSCGGATRLLRSRDEWIAVSLARGEDVSALDAWLGADRSSSGSWVRVAGAALGRSAADLVETAALLGIPCARLGEVRSLEAGDVCVSAGPATPLPLEGLTVVDLSSLWAGPLCTQVLQLAGARVIKVESAGRPDGARLAVSFFDLLHAGQESVALDLATSAGVAALRRLLQAADVVVEGSRPRALMQLGIDAQALVRSGAPRVWTSITGHGRSGPWSGRVALGDDAAVAGGLVVWDRGVPLFCADAIADPATGLVAAARTLRALAAGGSHLVDVAMSRVAAALVRGAPEGSVSVRAGASTDRTAAAPSILCAAGPRARSTRGRGPALGAHTEAVLAELT